jgi:hypothetical protein
MVQPYSLELGSKPNLESLPIENLEPILGA